MNFLNKILGVLKSKWIFGTLVLILIFGVYWFFIRSNDVPYKFIPVTRGMIIETVSMTGNTTPTKSVSLGFQNTGTIARVNYGLGDQVTAGSVIAELNSGTLLAALQQAEATLSIAKANLSALTAGTREEQLAIDRSAVTQNQTILANAIANAYIVSDSAIHTNVDQFFTNPRNSSAALTFVVTDAALANTVVQERIVLETLLSSWNAQISSSSFSSNDPTTEALQAVQNLTQINAFLNDIAAALTKTGSLSVATLQTYQSSVASARASVTGAISTLTSAKMALVNAVGVLTLAVAGSTSESIASQQAQVEQAWAGIASANASLQNARIIAPIYGVITEQNAKIGQLALPGTPLTSIMGTGGFEVDAGVSETDVGKLTVGNTVRMTFDAFPNETFDGSVFYIASAQTNTQGVISYQIKISFKKVDSRMKSGLTANIDVQTKKKDAVLILPQYAILQNDQGTFVEVLENKVVKQIPVTLGIADQKGNVEILKGVILGEQVLNIGLKAQ